MKKIILLLLFLYNTCVYSQINCYIYPEGSKERKACELSHKAIKYKQGSRKSQLLFDESISASPNFSWSYAEKSIPYFKRGFLLKGLELLNKAVELEPKRYLCYRAYWFFQYKNYMLCIKDLEKYYSLPNSYNELTPGGDKDMRILLGMSYAKLGEFKKGISIIEGCVRDNEKDKEFFFTDYSILGMLYFKNNEYNKALSALKIQIGIANNFPDTHYYLGLTYIKLNRLQKAKFHLKKALRLFESNSRIKNGYLCFRVYKSDVKKELKMLK